MGGGGGGDGMGPMAMAPPAAPRHAASSPHTAAMMHMSFFWGDRAVVLFPASSAAHAARMGVAYLVMLAVMSFNVGVLLAAVAGHALGFLLARSRVHAGGGGAAADARDREHGGVGAGGTPPDGASKA